MKQVLLILTVALFGCGTFTMHAQSDGKATLDTDGTFFAVNADGAAFVTVYRDGAPYIEYKVDAGKGKAWKRTSFLFWKTANWEEIPYEDAIKAIYPSGDVPSAPAMPE